MASTKPTNRHLKDRMKFWGKIALFCARKKGASQDFTFESVKGGVRISPVTKITWKYLFSECGIWKKKRWQPFGILSVALKISKLLPPYGAEERIWTSAALFTRPTPLAGEPLRPLGYFRRSMEKFSWRREWDSNPRMLSHRRFSRPVPSTARPSLRIMSSRLTLKRKNYITILKYCLST